MRKVMHQTIVSVGSNVEPRKNFILSQEILTKEVMFQAAATIIKTKPDGYQDQPDFLNGAYLLQTKMSYDAFNAYLKKLEKRMGRHRHYRLGRRNRTRRLSQEKALRLNTRKRNY